MQQDRKPKGRQAIATCVLLAARPTIPQTFGSICTGVCMREEKRKQTFWFISRRCIFASADNTIIEWRLDDFIAFFATSLKLTLQSKLTDFRAVVIMFKHIRRRGRFQSTAIQPFTATGKYICQVYFPIGFARKKFEWQMPCKKSHWNIFCGKQLWLA